MWWLRVLAAIAAIGIITNCGGGAAPSGQGAAGPVADYGDAPDGGPTGYPIPFAQVGRFPTLFRSNGARTLDTGQVVLGSDASAERDASDPADPDGVPNLTNQDVDDGITDFVIVLTSIPPPAGMAVLVTTPQDSDGGTYYLNVTIDLNMDGEWGGWGAGDECEWVAQNQVVHAQPGTSDFESVPPFAFTNGNRLPDGAWMRIALTRERIEAENWDGTGEFSAGEIEDHQVFLPRVEGDDGDGGGDPGGGGGNGGRKRPLMLAVRCSGPYHGVKEGQQIPCFCDVRNFSFAGGGTFDWDVRRVEGTGVDLAPPLNGQDEPIAAALAPGDTVRVNFMATVVDEEGLPCKWKFTATPDPDSILVPGGIIAGATESSGPVDFAGAASDEVTLSVYPTELRQSHQIYVSPCPQNVGSFSLRNGSSTQVASWSAASVHPALTIFPASGRLNPGASTQVTVDFNCATQSSFAATVDVTATGEDDGVEAQASVQVAVDIYE